MLIFVEIKLVLLVLPQIIMVTIIPSHDKKETFTVLPGIIIMSPTLSRNKNRNFWNLSGVYKNKFGLYVP